MKIDGLGEVMMITWAKLGVKIENVEETTESFTIWVSVPETSERLDGHGKEMSGMYLAKRLKSTLTEMGIKRLTVKSRIRCGDHWTPDKEKEAGDEAAKAIFGSQR